MTYSYILILILAKTPAKKGKHWRNDHLTYHLPYWLHMITLSQVSCFFLPPRSLALKCTHTESGGFTTQILGEFWCWGGRGAPGRRQHIGVMRVLALEPFSLHLISHLPLNKYFIASPIQAWIGHLIFLNWNISFGRPIDDIEVLKF